MSNELHVLGMNDDLWDKVRGLGSETWKGLHVQWSFQTFLKFLAVKGMIEGSQEYMEQSIFLGCFAASAPYH